MGGLPLSNNSDPAIDAAATFSAALDSTSPNAASTATPASVTGLGIYRTFLIYVGLLGATGGTLDVYLQSSADSGATWHDSVHFPQLAAAATLKQYFVTIADYTTSAAPTVVGSGLTPALAVNTVVPGSITDRLRVVYVAGAGTSAGAAQIIRVYCSS